MVLVDLAKEFAAFSDCLQPRETLDWKTRCNAQGSHGSYHFGMIVSVGQRVQEGFILRVYYGNVRTARRFCALLHWEQSSVL